MKTEKTKINGYDAFIYNTDKYPIIEMHLLFETEFSKRNIYLSDLLAEYMLYSCSKYKTREEIYNKALENYSMKFAIRNFNRGIKMFTEVYFRFYDPELIQEEYLKEALEFARDLLNPNFENGKLNQEELDIDKQGIISSVGRELKNQQKRASASFLNFCFPNSFETEDLIATKTEIEDLINSFTDEDIINMYDKIFNNSLVGMTLFGNIKDKYIEEIQRLFKFSQTKEFDKNYELELRVSDRGPEEFSISDKDYKESILRVIYDCPANSYKEQLAYTCITSMLGSNGLLLHKVLRDKYKYVYSTTAHYNRYFNCMVLRANIDKDSKDNTIAAMQETLSLLDDDELIRNLLDNILEKIELDLYTMDENPYKVLNEFINNSFDFDYSCEEKIEVCKTISVEDIKNALGKLKKVKVHFYKGVK